jgi:hypothetical protein
MKIPIKVELKYPRVEDNPDKVIISLMDVRAADDLLIEFDFDRNGWVIKMDETKDKDSMTEIIKEKVEVAFIPAWNAVEE